MGVPLGQQLCFFHQIRGILKAGIVSPHHTECYPSTGITSPTIQTPPPATILKLSQSGSGRQKTAIPPPHASLSLAGPSQDPDMRKACLLFPLPSPGKNKLPLPSSTTTSQPHQRTWPKNQQGLSSSDQLPGRPWRGQA
uniref:Uncharacterized protein n=1 Tax=Rousettus aegyptiacus TaxID=9407 RepID=A0A7J8GBA8_ROUAE|nr:hypothetical protein HJG63_011679 [Rousettus aegyptiacus]